MMTCPHPRRLPFLTFALAGACLLANAQTMQVAGWVIAFVYTLWQLLTREDGPGMPQALCRMLVLPSLILCIGLHGFLGNRLEDYGKDCWYFLAPLIYVAFGYLLAERIGLVKNIVYLFGAIGALVSLQSLWNIYRHGNLLINAASAEDYRHVVGIGAGQAMIPVVLIVMCRQAKIDLGLLDRHRWLRYFMMTAGSLSILLALSRTLLSILLLGVIVGGARRFLIIAAIVLGIGLTLPQTSSILDSAASQSFVDKFTRVGEEVQLHPYSSMAAINENWRGFEGYKALQAYRALDFPGQFFGGGFGTLVNLGFTMNLGGPTEIQEIPILHNGYLYLLVKTGLAGLTLFIAFIGSLLLQGRRMMQGRSGQTRLTGSLFLWSALTFLLTQGAITGIYNKGVLAPNLILLGVATAIRAHRATAEACCELREAPQISWLPSSFIPGQAALHTEVYEPS